MSSTVQAGLLASPEASRQEPAAPTRRTRVLRLFSRLNVGGPAIHVILTTAGLDPARYHCRLVVGKEGEREGNFFDLARSKGIELTVISSFVRNINPTRDLLTLARLVGIMKRERPDIVHTHTAKAGALGRLAARLAAVPVIVHSFHGSVFQGYFDPVSSRVFQEIERILARWTDAIVAVSPRVAEEIEKRRVAPRDRIVVIPLGLELERFRHLEELRGDLRRELGLPPSAPLIGSIGRLVPIKDLPTLLRAMRGLVVSRPDAVLLVVGDGPERERLESEAQRLLLGSRVRFLGFRRDLPRLYADLDLTVNSSLNEGTPVALIEAMAAGVPVVATRVGGTPDLLQDGRLGRLVPPGDARTLAETMLLALRRHDQIQDMAHRARQHVTQLFRSERLIEDLDRLYVRLLTRKGRRPLACQTLM